LIFQKPETTINTTFWHFLLPKISSFTLLISCLFQPLAKVAIIFLNFSTWDVVASQKLGKRLTTAQLAISEISTKIT